MMSDYVWHPPDDLVGSANITRSMRFHAIEAADTLLRRSAEAPAWSWPAVVNDP
ncbi:MAG: hypothetical protein GY778_25850, partial [bacterium]|nr:hypothetical protein [bacterium]